MHRENRNLHKPSRLYKNPVPGVIARLGFLFMQKNRSINFTITTLSVIDKYGFIGKLDLANRRPHPGPLQRRGCRFLSFLKAIFSFLMYILVLFKEFLCNKFVTPLEMAGVRPPGIIMKPFLFLYLLLLNSISSFAGEDHKISPADWHNLAGDKALNYKNDIEALQKPPVPQDPGAFQKFIAKIIQFFSGNAGTVIVWTLVIGIIAYIVYQVFLSKDSFLFSKNAKKLKKEEPAIEETEDISKTNWDALLRNAVDKQDLRLAVRYSYMWTLQLLQKKELISYRIDKTNFEYYRELSGAKQHAELSKVFRQLSRQYEYTWYGHFDISGARYNEYIDLFNHLKKQLGA